MPRHAAGSGLSTATSRHSANCVCTTLRCGSCTRRTRPRATTWSQSPVLVARELAARGIDTENRHWGSWTPAQVDAMHADDALAFGSLVHRTDELADAASRGLDALYSDHVDALVAAVSGSEA